MSDRLEGPSTDELAASEEVQPEKRAGIVRYLMIGLGGLAGFILLAFVVAILVGISNSEGLSSGFRIVRDFLIIVLALQGIFISLALIVLILQLASLINLLQNEIAPIIDELRETASTARGTAQFVSKNVTKPVIRIASTAAGIRTFVSAAIGLRRNTTGAPRNRR